MGIFKNLIFSSYNTRPDPSGKVISKIIKSGVFSFKYLIVSFIVDVAVALNIPFIKAGAVCRGERVCKYNRLLEIERNLSEE